MELNKFLGPERGACWKGRLEREFTVSQRSELQYTFSYQKRVDKKHEAEIRQK